MASEKLTTRGAIIAELTVGAGILVLAVYLTKAAGMRGFYPFDQSIVFDGSYRVATGQVPYRDFLAPFGPVTFWIHGLFFRLFGSTWRVYVAGACVINATAAAVSMLCVSALFPRLRLLPLVGGLVTAVWFYPPFGTPWVDQTAFFFALLAVWMGVKGLMREPGSHRRAGAVAASGGFVVLAFLSKQNVGSFIAPLFPLLLAVAAGRDGRRFVKDLGLFALGAGMAAGGFALWLALDSDPGSFLRYVFTIPAELGRERLSAFVQTWFGISRPFFGGRGPALMIIAAWGSFAAGAVVFIGAAMKSGSKSLPGAHRLAALLCLYLAAFQHLFINTTLNQPENGLAFTGVAMALGIGLIFSRTPVWRGKSKPLVAALLAVFLFFTCRSGYQVATAREVHEILRGSAFGEALEIEGLEGLRWASPMRIRGSAVLPEHMVALFEYLDKRGENFFVFPDFTILYGLLEVPSPQPLLWFHEGVTYSRENNGDLDKRIVAALKKNKVRIYVREQASWFNTGGRLDDFPELKAFLRGEFRKIGEIGIFSVYEKQM